MEDLDNRRFVQEALESMMIKYPSLSRKVILDIFRTAVEAKADEDQLTVSAIEMKSNGVKLQTR